MYQVRLERSLFPLQGDGALRETTVGGVLQDAAADSPDADALVEVLLDGTIGRTWTYAQLLVDAGRLADALLTRYAPGERIAIWAPNAPEWVVVEFAAALAGLVLVTVNPAYQPRELEFVLRQSGASGLLLVRECRGNPLAEHARAVRAALPGLREVVDIEDADALHARAGAPKPLPRVRAADPVQVQYTSGTTGFPKGAVLSHRNLTNNARFTNDRFGVERGETVLCLMPMFHTAGCSLAVLGGVQARVRLVMMRQF
ncbi:MAG TPA: AMP-binding protein, partial [Xanthomonadales bacterium]|nr:AMP-binding protein [Xanthomonadales bacterium]